MLKIDAIIGTITAICLVGVLVLLYIGESVEVLVPVLTALVAYLLGRKESVVVSIFKGGMAKLGIGKR